MSAESAVYGCSITRPNTTLPAEVLAERYRAVRRFSEKLVEPLAVEDCVIQSMPDVSPTKWHLAHTTWFFDRMVLRRAFPDRPPAHAQYDRLFNSYYNTLGDQFPRSKRGVLSRPTVAEVRAYRQDVDELVLELLARDEVKEDLRYLVETGINHEQQHQELMLTDIKHVFSCNPLCPVYRERTLQSAPGHATSPVAWRSFDEGLYLIGHAGDGFAYDNESPQHRVMVHGFQIASRLVTCGEFLAFINDGGYERPEFWLSDGWTTVQEQGWGAPLYWRRENSAFRVFTLSGLRPMDDSEPVCHVSFYEADAFARWSGARLPTEAEWEVAADSHAIEGNFVEREHYHPTAAPVSSGRGLQQMFGDVWEWTASPYVRFPGYQPPSGPLGEYNGKFMCNQMVLRGGSCATPQTHIRRTYRDFFPPHVQWQFMGIRLARDA